jgi:capsular polysaccharide export protein
MIRDLASFCGKNVLLLQGPLGPFFRRLSRDLTKAGAKVTKVNFNGGDWLFSSGACLNYTGHALDWPKYLTNLLTERNIDTILLFGDCRSLHRMALKLAVPMGIEVGVFEEGYVRPDYITFERYGVNANSHLSRDAAHYLSVEPQVSAARPVGNVFWFAALWAIIYYCSASILWPIFRRYQHHRPLTLLEAWPWIKSGFRKLVYAQIEQDIQDRLVNDFSKRFYLVPLQVHNDAQVHVHSPYKSVVDFIESVIASFVKHAPQENLLVIKHHPMDRGYHDYTDAIRQLSIAYNAPDRILYIHDQHLPTLLEHALGVALINSTVGLSTLHHGVPLKVCGDAIYDMPGLTYQGDLDAFWTDSYHSQIDVKLYASFISYLVGMTQVNGSFYRKLSLAPNKTGIIWSEMLDKAA